MRPRRVRIAQGYLDPLAESREPRPRASGRRRSKLRYGLTALGLVGVGGIALATANLYMMLDSEEIAEWIAPHASAALNRPVTVAAAGLSLWPRPAVRMTDVQVGNAGHFEGPALVRVGAARLEVPWLPLIVGRVQLERLYLEDAQIHLAVDEDGASNFGDLVPESAQPQSPLPDVVALRIRRISVSGGSITYFDAQGGRSAAVAGLDAEAVVAPSEEGGWRSTLAARSDSLLVRSGLLGEQIHRSAGPSAVVVARFGLDPARVSIDEGRLAFAHDTLAVRGALSLERSRPGVDLLLTDDALSPRFLASLFSTEARSGLLPQVEGSLEVTMRLEGGADEPPALRGSVRLRDVGLRLRGEPLLEGLNGVVALAPDTIAFDSLTGRLAGGPLDLSGTLRPRAGVTSFVARARPDLSAFGRAGLLPEGTTLSGNADLYLSVVGTSASPDDLEVVGVAELAGLQLGRPPLSVPLHVASGEISLVGREARWSDLAVLVGHDRLLTSGSLLDALGLLPGSPRRPHVAASVSGARLDLASVLPARDTATDATYPQLALAHLGGRVVAGRTASAVASARGMRRPGSFPVSGAIDVAIDTLMLRTEPLEGVRARVQLDDSSLVLSDLTFTAWDGRASGFLRLDAGRAAAEPFALTLSVQDVRAERFFATTSPFGDAVSGTLDLSLDVQGATDAVLLPVGEDLSGSMDLTITDGALAGTGVNLALADFLGDEAWTDVAFREWALDIGIEDRTLEIREGKLAGRTGDVVFSGPLRLDGSADLAVGLSIPPEGLANVSLRRTGIAQSVLDRLRAAGGPLDLGLRLSGWLQAPTLEPDASGALTTTP